MSPINGSKAPVCPISRDQALPGMPGRTISAIPRVTDLPSVIAALNQIALILNPGVNSGNSDGYSIGGSVSIPADGLDGPEQDGGGGPKRKKYWEEIDRGVEQVEVFNPDDHDISIKFPRIYQLIFEENRTITKLKWYL